MAAFSRVQRVTTLSRLKATWKKMAELLRKSGATQLTAIIFLVCVLIVLAFFVFRTA
jgi:hypothetical protein